MAVSFSLTKFNNGDIADADEVISNFSFVLTNMLNLILDGVTVTNHENYFLDAFGSDSAQSIQHMSYNSGSDRYETSDQSLWSDYYVDIYTTSTTGISALTGVHNCDTQLVSYDGSTYIYRMYSTSADAEVQRAEVMRTLFMGSSSYDGSGALVTGITGLTNLKSSDSRDVGKQAYVYAIEYTNPGGNLGGGTTGAIYDITFNNTSTNTSCSVWTTAGGMKNGTSPWYSGDIEFPTGTSVNSGSSSRSNEYGTDTSADEQDNPGSLKLESYPFPSGTSYGGAFQNQGPVSALILCVGTTSGSYSESSDPAWHRSDSVDFNITHSIPVFEAATFTATDAVLVTQLNTLSDAAQSALAKWFATVDSSNSLTVEFSADAGVNYTTLTSQKILHAIGNTGTGAQLRFTIDRSGTTGSVDYIEKYIYYHG